MQYVYMHSIIFMKSKFCTVNFPRSSGKKEPLACILSIDRSEGSHYLLRSMEKAVWIVYSGF